MDLISSLWSAFNIDKKKLNVKALLKRKVLCPFFVLIKRGENTIAAYVFLVR